MINDRIMLTNQQMDTINRLLKKQPSKRQRKIEALDADEMSDFPPETGGVVTQTDSGRKRFGRMVRPTFFRCVVNGDGNRMHVSEAIMDSPAGDVFGGDMVKEMPATDGVFGRRMVEEVE
jgi:Ino eighty subunit 2